MILVAGGTGRLGKEVVRLLLGEGQRVRVLTRDRSRADSLAEKGVEIVTGDVRDEAAAERATAGIETVVSAIHGFAGPGDVSPESVDHLGNRNLMKAALAGGASHFVLMSVVDAGPEHPMELHRKKFLAEQELRSSGLGWTIVRATAYMELWAELIGGPLLKTGKTTVFGRGENPINFVSVRDVARCVELAVVDPTLRGSVIEVGGPENLTANQVAGVYAERAGGKIAVSHLPLPVMRLASVLLKPMNPGLARQIQAAVVMDTTDMRFDSGEARRRYPSIPLTSLAEIAAGPLNLAAQQP